jgi:hypothetical protein
MRIMTPVSNMCLIAPQLRFGRVAGMLAAVWIRSIIRKSTRLALAVHCSLLKANQRRGT